MPQKAKQALARRIRNKEREAAKAAKTKQAAPKNQKKKQRRFRWAPKSEILRQKQQIDEALVFFPENLSGSSTQVGAIFKELAEKAEPVAHLS